MYEFYGDLRDEVISNSQLLADDNGTLVNQSSWQNVTSEFIDTVVNMGNYKTHPVIYLFGTASVVNVTINNDAFSFRNLNGYVYIDCKNLVAYTIEDNRKKSLLTNFSGVFPCIEVGENSIKVSGTDLNLDEVKLNFHNEYIV